MSSLQTKKKLKTGIPVSKITPRSNGEAGEIATAFGHPPTYQSQSEPIQAIQQSNQSRRNQPQQIHQLSSIQSNPNKATKKNQRPETWADEEIESQSQKTRNSSMSESRRRHEDMEKHLKEAESQLAIMGCLLEQREKKMKEAADEAEKKQLELEQQLHTQDGHLIKHGIDPVTGEQIPLNEEGEKKVESSKKVTKKRVQEMREKLKRMNNQTESYLSDIQNTLQLLNNLEAASDKLGLLSEGTSGQAGKTDFETDEAMFNKYHQLLTMEEMTSITRLASDENEIQNDDDNDNINLATTSCDDDRSVDDGDENIIQDEMP